MTFKVCFVVIYWLTLLANHTTCHSSVIHLLIYLSFVVVFSENGSSCSLMRCSTQCTVCLNTLGRTTTVCRSTLPPTSTPITWSTSSSLDASLPWYLHYLPMQLLNVPVFELKVMAQVLWPTRWVILVQTKAQSSYINYPKLYMIMFEI